MKFEDVLRHSTRLTAPPEAAARWQKAIFDMPADTVWLPRWFPSLASGLAMATMLLLLWPAAARGPAALRAAGVACDGRWELPLRADVRGVAQPTPPAVALSAPERCALCHLH